MKNYIFAHRSTSSSVWNKGKGTYKTTINGGKDIVCSTTDRKPSVLNADLINPHILPIKSIIYLLGLIITLIFSVQVDASVSNGVNNNTSDITKPPFDLNAIVDKAEHLPSLKDGKYIVKDPAYEAIFENSRVTYIPVISGTPSPNLFSFQVSTIGTSSGAIIWNNNKVTKPSQKENAIVYQRTSNIQEVYDNLNKGVEQSWIFNKNEGFSKSSNLQIMINVSTTLKGKSSPDSGIEFTNGEGVSQVRYSKAVVIDANKKRLEVEPVWNSKTSEVVLNISGEWLADAAYPVIVDPILNTVDINVDITAGTSQTYPSAAFDGTNYFVVYQSGTANATGTGTSDIKGVRVRASDGVVIDTTPLTIVATASIDEEHPSVVYIPTYSVPGQGLNTGSFYVVWEKWLGSAVYADIFLGVVDADTGYVMGTPTYPAFPKQISITSTTRKQIYPSIACCDGTYAYAVWGRSGNNSTFITSMRGALISKTDPSLAVVAANPTGTITNTTNAAGPTVASPTPLPVAPKVLSYLDAAVYKYLIVWEDFPAATGDIKAQIFTPPATFGTQWTIAGTANAERSPVPAFDGTNFLITYRSGATGGSADIYGQFATKAGANLANPTSPIVISATPAVDETTPGMVWIAGTCSPTPVNRYMVAWEQGTTVMAKTVTATGTVDTTAIPVSVNTTATKAIPAVIANEGSCGYFLAWSDNRNGNNDIFAQRVGYPNLSNLSPTSGAVGASISINGLNFGTDPGAGNRSTATNNIKINGVQVANANVTFWSDAVVTFTIPTGTTAGTYPVTVTAGSWTSNSNNLTVSTFGPATKVAFTTQPVGGSGGTVWATQPVATIQDSVGNTVTTATDNVTLSISSNPSAGTLTCTSTTVTAVNGVATFAGCKIDKAGSPYTLQAAATGLTSAISNTFNITVGTPAQLIFSTQPVYGITGTAWTTQPGVTVQDAGGNTVTTATNSITLAIGTNPGGGVLVCTTNPLSAISGIASFAGCQINMAGNGYTLTASATGLTGATSVTFNIIQALQISTVSLPNGYEWLSYSTTVTATGGAAPYTWSISTGTLPSGLTINPSSGVISGTPNAFGTYNFTVQVTDVTSPTIQTAVKAFSVIIYQLTTITVTPPNPVITPGQTVQFTATGTYSDNNTSDISTIVTWGSTNPSVATVNSTGLASGVGLGNVTITATK